MSIRSRKNPYNGINLHLNGFLQEYPAEQAMFFKSRAVATREYLDRVLPDQFYAHTSQSFHNLSYFHPSLRESVYFEPNSVLAYQFPLDPKDSLPHIRFEFVSDIVTRSPSKFHQYLSARQAVLDSNSFCVLVEIQILSPHNPLFEIENNDSFRIYITSSRNTPNTIHSWDIDELIPTFEINLNNEYACVIDLNIPYNHVYESTRHYYNAFDYASPPFADAYSNAKQQRISSLLWDFPKRFDMGG